MTIWYSQFTCDHTCIGNCIIIIHNCTLTYCYGYHGPVTMVAMGYHISSLSPVFIGTVVSSNHNEESGRGYRSIVKLERFLRHNETFLQSGGITPHPSCNHGNSTHHAPSSVGQQVKFPIQTTREIAVHSDCHLEITKKYFISANFRAGLKHKGKLTVSCAQSDVGYAVFQLQQLMASPTHCCN